MDLTTILPDLVVGMWFLGVLAGMIIGMEAHRLWGKPRN